MSRSAALLEWLRKTVADRGFAVGSLAKKSGVDRRRLRRILGGSEEMTVDELLALTEALELTPAELGLAEGTMVDAPAALDIEPKQREGVEVDPWGNHVQQLFEVAFGLGCDFFFLARTAELTDSGLPAAVLAQYEGRDLPIRLDAGYHKYNKPRYEAHTVTLTLSFDALYEVTIPWSAIHQVSFFPAEQEPRDDDSEETPEPPTPGTRPTLRLVT
ncbi:MAG: helix-turn-helix domain-containing protein [Proteobacteria bacterium]|nr:helix-turn-helix domain-containing protein [Pseudomonadota bacterium]